MNKSLILAHFLVNCWFSHDVTKSQTTKLSILLRFYFHGVLEQLKTNFQTNFRFKRFLGFVIEYAWISKLLCDAAFTWRPRELSFRLKNWLFSRTFAINTVQVLEKVLLQCLWVPLGVNSRFCSKLGNRCFCWFPSAMLELVRMSSSMSSPYKAL